MTDVTQILSQIESGDPRAAEQLLPLVYEELALVHDAYLRLVDVEKAQHWDSRGHFFAAAAEAIRRILIENARKKGRVRHGGGRKRVDLEQAVSITEESGDGLLSLDEALTRFAVLEPVKAELVKLRYFAGCSIDEAADLLGISRTSAKRYWAFARAWLLAELHDSDEFRNS
jgi:RNA polymerase sigma factor (TIGR02999 family)